MNPENKPDFRAEFVSFLKSRGYPTSDIFCNAKIGEINVDYLITLPNSNENLAIITPQRLDDNLAQLRRQVEMCRQAMWEANYSSVCILTPTTKAQSKYPFALYYIDNFENFQKINFELLPTFQELSLNLHIKEINNKPDFRAKFIRFLKSRGYPESSISHHAKIGETHVDCLITLPNSNEKLVILSVQRLDDHPAQLRRQVEMCRQEIGEAHYSVCILTPMTKAQSKYPFALYYLDNIENFQKINVELLPTFQELSLKEPTLEPPLSAKEMAKPVEMINLSSTMETDFQALEELPLSFKKFKELPLSAKEFEELPLSAKEIVKPFVPIVTIVIFSLLAIISLLSSFSVKSDVLSFLLGFGAFCLMAIGMIISSIALLRNFDSDESSDESQESSFTDTENKKRESFYKQEQKEKTGYFEWFILIVLLIAHVIVLVSTAIDLVSFEYGIAALLTLILMFLLIFYFGGEKDDETANYPMPSLTALNPDEIAVLRAGRKGIVHTALFNLCYIKELLMFKPVEEVYDSKIHSDTEKVLFGNIANVTRCYINNSSTQQPEGVIEEIVYQFAKNNQRPVKAKDFLADLSLRATLDELMEPIHQKLIQMHLLKTKNDKTTLGKNYLRDLKAHFYSEKYTISNVNPSLIFAIYGLKDLDTSKDFSGFAIILSDIVSEDYGDGDGDGDGGGCGGCGGGCGGG